MSIHPNHKSHRSIFLCALMISVSLSACSEKNKPSRLSAETASFDLAVGSAERVMVGVSDNDGNALTGGAVSIRVRPVDGQWSAPTKARSLAVPGRPAPTGDTPRLTSPSDAVGVYEAGNIQLRTPGFWEMEIDAGRLGKAMTAFEVHEQPLAVSVGSAAPKTENPTVGSAGVTPAQLDSLALDATAMTALTDPDLHRVQIAQSINDHRPLAIVVATPAYCTSQFCGPLVDEIAKLQKQFSNVDFVHLEVYPDGFDKPISAYAAQWIAEGGSTTGDGNEPWVFVVDGSGTVTQRWDNVVDMDKFATELKRLNS